MIEKTIQISTKDGQMTTFIVHPERDGPHPAIIMYMDATGIRDELRSMASRLATVGYYVLLPNLYYRVGVEEIEVPQTRDSPEFHRMLELIQSLNIPMIMNDTEAIIAHVKSDPEAKNSSMGAVGYCMSGQFAIYAAGQFPETFAAAASFYGVRIMTHAEDSPHLMAQKTQAELYIAFAEHDPFVPLEIIDPLREALQGLKAEVEFYPNAAHGFAFPERSEYNRSAAERHWERLFSLWERNLH